MPEQRCFYCHHTADLIERDSEQHGRIWLCRDARACVRRWAPPLARELAPRQRLG